jgi:hypothetical protein
MSQVRQDLWLIVKVKSNDGYSGNLLNKSIWFFGIEAVPSPGIGTIKETNFLWLN